MAFDKLKLRRMMDSRGTKQKDLAARVGVDVRTVSRWLNDGPAPKAANITDLAEALDCGQYELHSFGDAEEAGKSVLSAEISAASRNAFDLVMQQYSVCEQDIVELAPILFAIAAGRALRLTKDEEEAMDVFFESTGLSYQNQNMGWDADRDASAAGKILGVLPEDPNFGSTRNLLASAIIRMSREAAPAVDATGYAYCEPGAMPTAHGMLPIHKVSIAGLTGEDHELEDAILHGKVLISDLRAKGLREGQTAPQAVREHLDAYEKDDQHRIEEQRAHSQRLLEEWRAEYAAAFPSESAEFDKLAEMHCFPLGSGYPDYYSAEDRKREWADAFGEHYHLNPKTLIYHTKDGPKPADSADVLFLPFSPGSDVCPEQTRFDELTHHRTVSKAKFRRRIAS